ncbi:amino acid racemase [Chitinophaga sp.]|uniref:aspartate/glutamate racemase family protein n=1 Tax=Chitinophaga sp. TaxID=1869181 RepID=UPI0031D369FE
MNTPKKLGIIGGMGSRAGALFLNKVIDYSPALKDQEFPEIFFHNNAVIPDRTKAVIYNGESPMSAIYRSLELFNQNKVDVIALTCMTVHYYYEQISVYAHARVMNPLDLIAEHIRQNYPDAKRIGVLAGTGAINGGIYHKALKDQSVELVTLDPEDQESIFMRALFMENGFKSAVISDEAKGMMTTAMDRLVAKGVDLFIGGCTEVSIGIDPLAVDTPYIDALDLLARKTVDFCYSGVGMESPIAL